ncbi:MAG: ATP-grasp ribosomal peptide maturase [Pseudonocardiaceae bacterium]
MTVLVLTRPNDGTAGGVVAELERRGVTVVRGDVGDFPLEVKLTASLVDQQEWRGSLTIEGRSVPLDEIRAIYYRRPTGFRFPDHLSPGQQRFARAEARRGLGGLLLTLPVRWVSHPSRVADAEFKPLQLQLAAACGLRVPRTLLTNEAEHARELAQQLSGTMIYKPLSAPRVHVDGELRFIYASQVEVKSLNEDDIGLTAHLFQEWVPKKFDLRLTVVGDQFFAVAIHANSDEAYTDWRSDYISLAYEPIDTPVEIRHSITILLERLGLSFGAFDFTVTPDDEWVFLEINPNGQWGWIEERTGLPITSAMADLLTHEAVG